MLQELQLKVNALTSIESAEALAVQTEAEMQELHQAFLKAPSDVSSAVEPLMARLQNIQRQFPRKFMVFSLFLERLFAQEVNSPLYLKPCDVLELICSWIERYGFKVPTARCGQLVSLVGGNEMIKFLVHKLGGTNEYQNLSGLRHALKRHRSYALFVGECASQILLFREVVLLSEKQMLINLVTQLSYLHSIERRELRFSLVGGSLLELWLKGEAAADFVMDVLISYMKLGFRHPDIDMTVLISAIVLRLRIQWDDSLWEAVLPALGSLRASGFGLDVSEILITCLQLQRQASKNHASALVSILSLPHMPSAVKTRGAGSIVSESLRSELTTSPPPPFGVFLELLQLSNAYNISIEPSTYNVAVNSSIDSGEEGKII